MLEGPRGEFVPLAASGEVSSVLLRAYQFAALRADWHMLTASMTVSYAFRTPGVDLDDPLFPFYVSLSEAEF